MADDRYDSDYWAMAAFQFQELRASLFGLPAVPGGREFRPAASGPASPNIEDRRGGWEPTDETMDENLYGSLNRSLSDVFRNQLMRVEPWPLGNPESFQGQDPLR